MSRDLSEERRKVIIITSAAICLILVLVLVIVMNNLTRRTLNNDDIRVSVECTYISSDGVALSEINDPELSTRLLPTDFKNYITDDISLCHIDLKYYFYNYTGSELSNFSMLLSDAKLGDNYVYAYTPLRMESSDDDKYVYTQRVFVDSGIINPSYFTNKPPFDFKGAIKHEFSYDKKGEFGRKTLIFTTMERETEKNVEPISESDSDINSAA